MTTLKKILIGVMFVVCFLVALLWSTTSSKQNHSHLKFPGKTRSDYQPMKGVTVKGTGLGVEVTVDPTKIPLRDNESLEIEIERGYFPKTRSVVYYANGPQLGFKKSGNLYIARICLDPLMLHQNEERGNYKCDILISLKRSTYVHWWSEAIHVDFKMDPLIIPTGRKDLWVMADRSTEIDPKLALENMQKACLLVENVNSYIDQLTWDDPDTVHDHVLQVAFWLPVDERMYSQLSEGLIAQSVLDLGNRGKLLTQTARDSMHFVFPVLHPGQKQVVYNVFYEYQRLTKNSQLSRLFTVGEPLIHPDEYGIENESGKNARALFVNVVAMANFNSAELEHRLAKLPPELQKEVKNRVIEPTLSVFGPDRKKLFGKY